MAQQNVFKFEVEPINKTFTVRRSMGTMRVSAGFMKYILHFGDDSATETDDSKAVSADLDKEMELIDKVTDFMKTVLPGFTQKDAEKLTFNVDLKTGIDIASALAGQIQGSSAKATKETKSGQKSESLK